jgi:hypothetical protein
VGSAARRCRRSVAVDGAIDELADTLMMLVGDRVAPGR